MKKIERKKKGKEEGRGSEREGRQTEGGMGPKIEMGVFFLFIYSLKASWQDQ